MAHRGQTPLVLALCLLATTTVVAARLKPEAETAWTKYVTATEGRIAGELAAHDRFLALDFTPTTAADRRALLRGDVVVHGVESLGASGETIDIPSALIHHWRGAVFVPRATVDGFSPSSKAANS